MLAAGAGRAAIDRYLLPAGLTACGGFAAVAAVDGRPTNA